MTSPNTGMNLNQLEQCDWGDPPADATGLIERCYQYRRIPLCELADEHLRTLILQNISLPHLIPLAIAILDDNPLAAGDLNPGALLGTVLNADSKYWVAHPAERARVTAIVERADSARDSLDESDRATVDAELAQSRDIFQRAEYFAKHGRA